MRNKSRFKILRSASVITTAVLIVSVAGITAYQIHNGYVNTIENAQLKLLGYAKALDEHASHVFGESEQTLNIILDRIAPKGAPGELAEKQLHDIVKSEVVKLPQAAAAFVTDKNGIFKAYSEELPTRPLNVSDRDYFRSLRDDPATNIYISRPVRNRGNNLWRVMIAKKIRDKNGGFAGVVGISFKPEYFENFYRSMNIGASARINIMRTDGYTIIVSPFNEASYEQNFSDRPIFKTYLPASPTGFYRAPKFGYDLSDRMAAYSKLSPYPTMALVSLRTDEVLSEWKSQTLKQSGITAVFVLVLVVTGALLVRQLRRLEETEVHLRGIIESTDDGILAVNNEGKTIRSNRRFAELWKIPREILDTGNDDTMQQFVLGQLIDPDAFLARVKALYGSDRSDTDTLIFKDGRVFERFSAPLLRQGERIGRVWSFRDITGRRRAEAALQESEKRLRDILDSVGAYIFIKDRDYRYSYVNRKVCDLFGRREAEILGRGDDAFFSRASVEEIMRSDRRVIEGGETVTREETDLSSSDNISRTYWTVKIPLRDNDGSIYGLCGISTDISERIRSEDALRRSEEMVRNILDSVDEGFIVVDRDYRIVTANRSYCSQLGKPCDEVVGEYCFKVSHKLGKPCYEEGVECAVRKVFETGQPSQAYHTHHDPEGKALFVETKAFPLRDASGAVSAVIESVNNITEKHLLEQERLKTQKLEAIGTLAGGIAHDFNNLLQGLFGYISLARLTADSREKSVAALEQAEKALHMSVRLTNQLLTFSKGGKPVKKLISLRPMIENAVQFALSGSRSDYRIVIEEDLWQAEADEGQIGQVIQNIVLNADQAMPAGGRLEVMARNALVPGKNLPQGLPGGKYAEIEIRDSGIGIPEQYIDRIFDPYFTTKEKGSGLGLATSYSIIKNHGGLIQVTSVVGKGTTFSIYLPAVEALPGEAVLKSAEATAATRTGKVLLMDDEQIVREVAGELIRELGHEAEFASNGDEAISKYRAAMQSGKPYDVVILDLTIRGGMGGAETVRKLTEIDRGVNAVASSGYSDDTVASDLRQQGFKAFLKKPYNVDDLRAVLNSMLG